LFISILSAASCGQPLQVIVVPRGALTFLAGRLRVLIVLTVPSVMFCLERRRSLAYDPALKEAI
jgi:hypothetical protein